MRTSFGTAAFVNTNTIWCQTLVDEILLTGMQSAILCVGGRSAAMTMVLNSEPALETVIFNDERAGAFFALGLSKASGRPVGICTTSGSAVANLAPALTEAHATGVPLIVLSCDRPRSVHDAGAPQCADHVGMCRSLVEGGVDFGDPEGTESVLASMRQRARETLAILQHPGTRGPVHFNIPLHEELTSVDPEPGPRAPLITAARGGSSPESSSMSDAHARLVPHDFDPKPLDLGPGMKGLIFVGPDAPVPLDVLTTFATSTCFPVLADMPSGLRRPRRIPFLISDGDLLLASQSQWPQDMQPDLVIRFGEAPIAHTAQRFLSRAEQN